MAEPCFGIFVGGRGRRMGGVAKGKLRLPTEQTVIARLIAECRAVRPEARILLVGQHEEYSDLGLIQLSDDPSGVGPIGGLLALLREAAAASEASVLALACDLPFLSRGLIRRLTDDPRDSLALAVREANFWQPFAARYSPRVLPTLETLVARGERSIQQLFIELGAEAVELSVSPEELSQLRDWDCPEDMRST